VAVVSIAALHMVALASPKMNFCGAKVPPTTTAPLTISGWMNEYNPLALVFCIPGIVVAPMMKSGLESKTE